MMRTLQLHDFVKQVAAISEAKGWSHLCIAAQALDIRMFGQRAFGIRPLETVISKLLEESYPSFSGPNHTWAKGCSPTITTLAENSFGGRTHNSIELRKALVAKLLAQPDRTLVIPNPRP